MLSRSADAPLNLSAKSSVEVLSHVDLVDFEHVYPLSCYSYSRLFYCGASHVIRLSSGTAVNQPDVMDQMHVDRQGFHALRHLTYVGPCLRVLPTAEERQVADDEQRDARWSFGIRTSPQHTACEAVFTGWQEVGRFAESAPSRKLRMTRLNRRIP